MRDEGEGEDRRKEQQFEKRVCRSRRLFFIVYRVKIGHISEFMNVN